MSNASEHIENELLARYLDGTCSGAEVEQVNAWVDASAENKATFEAFKKLWEVAELPLLPAKNSPSDAAYKALEKVKQRIADEDREAPVVRLQRTNTNRTWFRAAAAILILFGVSITYFMLSQNASEEHAFVTHDTIETFALPDGSTVTLNRNSKLEYPSVFEAGQREVALVGEGFFEIKRDVKHPFIVKAGEAQVEVLGTSFSVSNYANNGAISVNVATGKVKLASAVVTDQNVILTPGNRGELNRKNGEVTRSEVNEPEVLFWKNKTLIFRDTELKEVFDVLNRVYEVRITVQNSQINSCPLSATFKDQSIEEIIEIIANTFSLEIEQTGKSIQINGDGC